MPYKDFAAEAIIQLGRGESRDLTEEECEANALRVIGTSRKEVEDNLRQAQSAESRVRLRRELDELGDLEARVRRYFMHLV